jgi:hypothetical protein
VLKRYASGGVQKVSVSTIAEAAGAVQAIMWDVVVETALLAGHGLHKLEAPFMPILAGFVAPVLSGLFGAELDEATFARKLAKGGGANAGQAIVQGFFKAIEGDSGADLTPGPHGAQRIAGAAVAASLESSFNALVPEVLSSLLPLEIGHFRDIMELPEHIIRSLGVGRLVRRAIGPLVTTACTTPMEWHVHKKYRPTLLSPSDTVRQVLRGRWDHDKALEELARQGYSDDRIEALFNSAAKFFGPGDVDDFVTRGHWTRDAGVKHLRDQGYSLDGAEDALRLAGIRRFQQLETAEAHVLITAYAARDIDRATFAGLLRDAVSVESERHLLTELAEVRRAVTIKRLTLKQVEGMVRSGVLNVRDYRDTAIREGYPPEDVVALELQLRWELDTAKKLDAHRLELEAEHAADKAAREQEAADRKAAVAKERALTRRGAESDLERAVVRGVIPLARLEEVYRARYDADTAAILLTLTEDARLAYVAQEQAREDALTRGQRRNIDVGALEQAVLAHILTLQEFRARLDALGFDPADAQLLTAVLEQRQHVLAETKAAHDQAAAAAKVRSIDLGRFEMLVRRGARSFAQYDALLAELGFEDAARADMRELLQLHVDDDARARQLRDDAEARLMQKGLSLEQVRRAVLLGVKSVDDFGRFLVEHAFTADAQITLLAELRADVADAEAARLRRETPAPGPPAPGIPVSTIRRAAQLGVVTVDTYHARLLRDGYSAEDIAIEMDLLLYEIADVQAKRRARDAAPPPAAPRDLSLADVARGVKAGLTPLDVYRAQAIGLGYSAADAGLLTALLEHELRTLAAARQRHDELAFELAARGLSLPDVEARVLAGELTLEAYKDQLEAWGAAPDEAELLAGLLAFRLEQAAAGGG